MKPPKRIVVLSSAEYGLAFNGMLHFRNKLIQQGRYTYPLGRFFGMWREGPCAGKPEPYQQPFVAAWPKA